MLKHSKPVTKTLSPEENFLQVLKNCPIPNPQINGPAHDIASAQLQFDQFVAFKTWYEQQVKPLLGK